VTAIGPLCRSSCRAVSMSRTSTSVDRGRPMLRCRGVFSVFGVACCITRLLNQKRYGQRCSDWGLHRRSAGLPRRGDTAGDGAVAFTTQYPRRGAPGVSGIDTLLVALREAKDGSEPSLLT